MAHAAKTAKVEHYELRIIPEPKDFVTALVEGMAEDGEQPTDLRLGLGAGGPEGLPPLAKVLWPVLEQLDPLRARAARQALQRVELIHRENAVLMMPMDLVFR